MDPRHTFGIWWAFHHLGLFRNSGYAVVLLRAGSVIAHRSIVTPRYFRFPFMDEVNFQIGDVWTHSVYRGKGLTPVAVGHLLAGVEYSDRRIWYLTEDDDHSSRRLAEKVGFEMMGEGTRVGVSLLGRYLLTMPEDDAPSRPPSSLTDPPRA